VGRLDVNGIDLHYLEEGSGPPVLLVNGTGGNARTWQLHQVPALVAAGYRTVAIDNRGIAPTDCGDTPFTIDDMADDVLAVIDALDLAPCRLVAFSLGSQVVLRALSRAAGRVDRAVLMGARGRRDTFGSAFAAAELALHDSGTTLPPEYRAMVKALQYLSPATLAEPRKARNWLQIFTLYGDEQGPAMRRQLACNVDDAPPVDHTAITMPVLVLSFADDRVTPAALGRELAELLPRGEYQEVADTGHYGHLERPAEVNQAIMLYLTTSADEGLTPSGR